jgi:hypothetical protein
MGLALHAEHLATVDSARKPEEEDLLERLLLLAEGSAEAGDIPKVARSLGASPRDLRAVLGELATATEGQLVGDQRQDEGDELQAPVLAGAVQGSMRD